MYSRDIERWHTNQALEGRIAYFARVSSEFGRVVRALILRIFVVVRVRGSYLLLANFFLGLEKGKMQNVRSGTRLLRAAIGT